VGLCVETIRVMGFAGILRLDVREINGSLRTWGSASPRRHLLIAGAVSDLRESNVVAA